MCREMKIKSVFNNLCYAEFESFFAAKENH